MQSQNIYSTLMVKYLIFLSMNSRCSMHIWCFDLWWHGAGKFMKFLFCLIQLNVNSWLSFLISYTLFHGSYCIENHKRVHHIIVMLLNMIIFLWVIFGQISMLTEIVALIFTSILQFFPLVPHFLKLHYDKCRLSIELVVSPEIKVLKQRWQL